MKVVENRKENGNFHLIVADLQLKVIENQKENGNFHLIVADLQLKVVENQKENDNFHLIVVDLHLKVIENHKENGNFHLKVVDFFLFDGNYKCSAAFCQPVFVFFSRQTLKIRSRPPPLFFDATKISFKNRFGACVIEKGDVVDNRLIQTRPL